MGRGTGARGSNESSRQQLAYNKKAKLRLDFPFKDLEKRESSEEIMKRNGMGRAG